MSNQIATKTELLFYCQRHGLTTGLIVDRDCDGCVDLVNVDSEQINKNKQEKKDGD